MKTARSTTNNRKLFNEQPFDGTRTTFSLKQLFSDVLIPVLCSDCVLVVFFKRKLTRLSLREWDALRAALPL